MYKIAKFLTEYTVLEWSRFIDQLKRELDRFLVKFNKKNNTDLFAEIKQSRSGGSKSTYIDISDGEGDWWGLDLKISDHFNKGHANLNFDIDRQDKNKFKESFFKRLEKELNNDLDEMGKIQL